MSRIACLLIVITAACSSGPDTGEASLSNTMPPVKSSAAKPFKGADGAGNMVLGWKIELYSDDPGSDCTSAKKVGTIGIYSNMAASSGDQAILTTGDITISMAAPPMVIANAAANINVDGFTVTNGLVTLSEFHLTADAKHADRIAGMVSAGATDGSGASVSLSGMFTAPICD